MKNTKIQFNFKSFLDESTNAKITCLTPLSNHCHRNYFYQKCETKDNKLLFAGDFENNNRNYYLLDLQTQIARQITEGSGDNVFGGFLSNDDKFLFYVKNNKELRKVNLESLAEQIIYTTSDDFVAYGTWTSNNDNSKIVAIEILKQDYRSLDDWQIFAEFFQTKPFCRMIEIDVKTGEFEILHQENRWLGHPIYKPDNNDIICFCHEGPHDLIESRMNIFNKQDKSITSVHKNAIGESCTHEFWQPNGEKLIFVSYEKSKNTRTIKTYQTQVESLMLMPNCSHLYSNFDGSLLVGDGSGTPADVDDKNHYQIENDEFLYLFDTKQKTYKQICKHKSSWQVILNDRQITHPHPSFFNNDKQVLFSSDFEGKVAIYLVTLNLTSK